MHTNLLQINLSPRHGGNIIQAHTPKLISLAAIRQLAIKAHRSLARKLIRHRLDVKPFTATNLRSHLQREISVASPGHVIEPGHIENSVVALAKYARLKREVRSRLRSRREVEILLRLRRVL